MSDTGVAECARAIWRLLWEKNAGDSGQSGHLSGQDAACTGALAVGISLATRDYGVLGASISGWSGKRWRFDADVKDVSTSKECVPEWLLENATQAMHERHAQTQEEQTLNIVLSCMEGSIFNRSIWEGLARGFASLGHHVVRVGDRHVAYREPLPFEPDLFLAVHGGTVSQESVQSYRKRGVLTAVYLLDEPYEVDRSCEWARWYEWVLSVDRQTVPIHGQWSRSLFLPLAYDADRFRAFGKRYPSSILVLGSPYDYRLQFLAPLRKQWGKHVTWVGPGWRRFCPDGRHVEDLVSPDVCARFYRGAETVINIHRDSVWSHWGKMNRRGIEASHLNPRFWEAAACGSFQLTSYRSDLELFAPESASFRDSEQLNEQLHLYSEKPSIRAQQIRYLSTQVGSHSYRNRCQDIVSEVLKRDSRAHLEPSHSRLKSIRRAVDNTGEAKPEDTPRVVDAPARTPGELNQGGV